MDLEQVIGINKQKEDEVMKMITSSNDDVISMRSINEQTGVSYGYIRKIAEENGYIIKKKPFPSHIKRLCVIKNDTNNTI